MPKRILLVDDEPNTVLVMEHNFRRWGYDVSRAEDGEEAWILLQQTRPDLIVADYQMPRLDGLGLAARVRGSSATADIPIIMFTVKRFELSPEEFCQPLGIAAVLPKPFNPREFKRLVEQVLANAATVPPARGASAEALPQSRVRL
jgi:CheY-like chemotaxis protein